jgi:hypothetical protein
MRVCLGVIIHTRKEKSFLEYLKAFKSFGSLFLKLKEPNPYEKKLVLRKKIKNSSIIFIQDSF